MKRLALTLLSAWICVIASNAASNKTTAAADSLNSAVASVLLPSIDTELTGKTGEYRKLFAKGLRDGATDTALVAYAKAIIIGSQMKDWVEASLGGEQIGADRAKIIALLADYVDGAAPMFTSDKAQAYIQSAIVAAFPDNGADIADPAAEAAFLAAAAATPGAATSPDSLVVVTVSEGTGNAPQPGSTVLVVYTAQLSDGTVFDSTGDTPVRLAFDSLVPGMQRGLAAMRQGGKARIYIPASLGYGSEGYPGVIPGGAALLFDIELKEIL